MVEMLTRALFILGLIEGIRTNWDFVAIGNVKRVEFYHEHEELKGIWVITDEGRHAMLDPMTGDIVWRGSLFNGSATKVASQEFCSFFLNSLLDGVVITNKNMGYAINLRTGNTIAEIQLNQDPTMPSYKDIRIETATEQDFIYGIMTNIEIRFFHFAEERSGFKARANEFFVFLHYHEKGLAIGSLLVNDDKVCVRLNEDEIMLFCFEFKKEVDVLMKILDDVYIVKVPPHHKETSVSVYGINSQKEHKTNFRENRVMVLDNK